MKNLNSKNLILKKINPQQVTIVFSKRLNLLCKKTNITIRKISEITEIDLSLLKAISLGAGEINFDILYACACFFNVSADYLLGLIKDYDLENLSPFEPDPNYFSAAVDGSEFGETFCCHSYSNLSSNLRGLRKELNLTKSQIANLLQINENEVVDWETPSKFSAPTPTQLIMLADFFEVSVDYLLGLEDILEINVTNAMGENASSERTGTEQERELLRYFRELSPYLKGVALDTVRGWADKEGGSLHKKA